MEVVRLERSRLGEASDVLARAFHDDPAWIWLIPDDERRRRSAAVAVPGRLRGHGRRRVGDHRDRARRRAVAAAGAAGDAGRADAARARGDAVSPRRRDHGVPRLRPGGRDAARRRSSAGRTGTSPASASTRPHSGTGIGSALIAPGIEAAARAGLPTVLLTNNAVNLPFYERQGFVVVREDETPRGGPHAWAMVKAP